MSMVDTLSRLSTAALDGARRVGLPADAVQELYDQRLQLQVIKVLSTRAIPFVHRSGVRILTLEPGRVVCEMPLKGNVNHIGTMYAGALFTLAEFPGGPLMLATYGLTRFIPIVTSLDMEFVKAAKSDVRVELSLPADEADRIEQQTLANGQAEFELTGELKAKSGDVVARSLARYQMRPRRR